MSTVRGDFGVKSDVVQAANRDPEYRGAETVVVPLYIPKGAIPLRLERTPRSGAHERETSIRLSRIPLRQRSRIISVTSRKKIITKRPPQRGPITTPITFPRNHGRRISSRITRRIDSGNDSDKSESSSRILNDLKKLKSISKSPPNSFTAKTTTKVIPNAVEPLSRNHEVTTNDSLSNRGTPAELPTKFHEVTKLPSNFSNTEGDNNHTDISSTQIRLPLKLREPPTHRILKKRKIERPRPTVSTSLVGSKGELVSNGTSSNLSPSPITVLKSSNIKKIKNHTLTTEDAFIKVGKNYMEKTTHASTDHVTVVRLPFPPRPSSRELKLIKNETKVSPESYFTPETTTEKSHAASTTTKLKISQTSTPVFVYPSTSPTTTVKTTFKNTNVGYREQTRFKNVPRNSIKRRVPTFNRKSLSTTAKPGSLTTVTEENLTASYTTKKRNKSNVTLKPLSRTVRRRKPLKPSLPSIRISEPRADISFISNQSTTIPSKNYSHNPFNTAFSNITSFPTTLKTQKDSTSTSSVVLRPAMDKTDPLSPTESEPLMPNTTTTTTNVPKSIEFQSGVVFTTSPTTTSSIRDIHKFFNITKISTVDFARTEIPVVPSSKIPQALPSATPATTKILLQTTPKIPAVMSQSAKPVHQSSSIAQTSAGKAIESLSEVMRHATTATRSKVQLEEIATDLDNINKKLADEGILILHAEIDGKSIRLKNHTKIRNGTHFISTSDAIKRIKRPRLRQILQKRMSSQSNTNIKNSISKKPNITSEHEKHIKQDVDLDITQTTDNYKEKHIENTLLTTKLNENTILTTDKTPISKKTSKPLTIPPDIFITTTGVETASQEVTSISKTTERPLPHDFLNYIDTDITTDTENEVDYINSNHNVVKPASTDKIDIIYKSDKVDSKEADNSLNKFETILIIDAPVDYTQGDARYTTTVEETPLIEGVTEHEATEEGMSYAIYSLALIAVFPVAGMVAYFIRRYLRGDSLSKTALADSEERPDGFGYPSHLQSRTQTLLPVW